jgi:catechol 2,3-dioxygenase-like lactoylglutathione lyase family enzyme
MIRSATLVLAVHDLERSAAFYRDVPGFEVRELGDPGWRMFVSGGCRIMAGRRPDAVPAAELGDHSSFAYLGVDEADADDERARALGVAPLTAARRGGCANSGSAPSTASGS